MKRLAFVLVMMAGGSAAAQKKIDDIKKPDPKAPFSSWTAAQQWMPGTGHGSSGRYDYGYSNLSGVVLLADELGDRLSALGRASLVELCFQYLKPDTTSLVAWAMCGPDVEALDLKKVEAELTAEGIGPDSKKQVIDDITTTHDKAKKIGEAVNAAAKSDPGVAAVLKAAATARTEWAAYASKNKAAIDRYLALKDAVRSGKSNDKGFDGCYEATKPAFEKLVKASKPPVETDGHPMVAYVSALTGTVDGYVTTVAYAACAWAQHKAGESIYVAAANRVGGDVRFGARSLALSKLLDPTFKPNFADRALSFDTMRNQWRYGVQMTGVLDRASIMTPGGAVVDTVKKDGDITKVTFKTGSVDRCLQWKDTNKIAQISPNGSITYDKVCLKRGNVPSTASPVDVPTKYATGIAPGVEIVTVLDFPVLARKGGKLIAMLGVAK